jgi:nucleotide-binding universal stress UspA family protein
MEASATSPRIVVGVDGSEHAKKALEWAIDEAKLRGGAVQVVTAWHLPLVAHGHRPGPPASLSLEDVIREAAEGVAAAAARDAGDAGAAVVEPVIRRGQAADVLVDVAEEANLLVVGSRGYGSFPGLVAGSVSLQCAQHAHCPTTIVR